MNNKKDTTILVVEDEQDFSESIQIRLKSKGYTVMSANDGREAVSCALKNKPDVILLDIHMPNGDGHSVVSRLKKSFSDDEKAPLVIYMTASRNQNDIEKACVNEATGYLIKPFSSDQLFSQIQKALLLH